MSKSRAKGTAAETAVVRYLQSHGFPRADRAPLRGSLDTGDITGVEIAGEFVVLEVKNCKTVTLAAWLDELEVEMENAADTRFGSVIHKRRGTTDVGDWYATMPVSVLVALLLRLEGFRFQALTAGRGE